MFTPRFRRRLLISWLIIVLSQLIGGSVNYYSNIIFMNATHNNKFLSFVLCVIIPFYKAVINIITGTMTKRFGRKILSMVGCTACDVALILLSVSLYIYEERPDSSSFLQDACIVLIYIFMFGYAIGVGPIQWLILVELVPEKGVQLGTIINWVFVAIIIFLFPILVDLIGIGEVFGIFSIFLTIGIILLQAFMIETKGLTNQQIEDAYFQKKDNIIIQEDAPNAGDQLDAEKPTAERPEQRKIHLAARKGQVNLADSEISDTQSSQQ